METVDKMTRQYMEWEKILANRISDKPLISKIYKDLYNQIAKKTPPKPPNTLFYKWEKGPE